MTRGENSVSIPVDLVMEILSRLPAKSIARCRCVSKVWSSMLLRPYFTNLFHTKTSARPPRLLLAVKRLDDWCFLTSSEPEPQKPDETQKPDEKWSWSSLSADFHMKFHAHKLPRFGGHASGFIYLRSDGIGPAICNPSTGQYLRLPFPSQSGRYGSDTFLGFDPIDKQFKILSIPGSYSHGGTDQILTLGRRNNSWRKIYCPINHDPVITDKGICINGVLYYLAQESETYSTMIVCFDVRTEKFKFIYRYFEKKYTKLVNYKGELNMVVYDYRSSPEPGRYRCLVVWMWPLKDAENLQSKWSSKDFSYRWDVEYVDNADFSIVGVTARGDIVLSNYYAYHPFYVFYIYPDRKSIQMVEIQDLQRAKPDDFDVQVFPDYVENLNRVNI